MRRQSTIPLGSPTRPGDSLDGPNATEEPLPIDDGGEMLTVAQAAERLSMTEPRLRRILARPEYIAHVQTVT